MHGRRAALHRHHRAHLRPDPAPGAGRLQGQRRCGAAAATIARAAIAATFDRRWVDDGDAWRVALPCVRAASPCRTPTSADIADPAGSDRHSAAPWCDPWLAARGHGRPGRSDGVADAAEDQTWCGQRALAAPQCAPRGRGRSQPARLVRLPAGSGHLARAGTALPNMGPADDRASNSGGCAATARRRALGIALCRCESDADL